MKRKMLSRVLVCAFAFMLLCACGQQASSQMENAGGKSSSSALEDFQKQAKGESGEDTAAEDEDGEDAAQTSREITVTELYSVDDKMVNEEDDYVVEFPSARSNPPPLGGLALAAFPSSRKCDKIQH